MNAFALPQKTTLFELVKRPEVAVDAFLKEKIAFTEIVETVEKVRIYLKEMGIGRAHV